MARNTPSWSAAEFGEEGIDNDLVIGADEGTDEQRLHLLHGAWGSDPHSLAFWNGLRISTVS